MDKKEGKAANLLTMTLLSIQLVFYFMAEGH
jgi:hypothetical protein